MTEKEFELLKLLIENKGVTLKKEYIFNTIWGSDSDSELQTLTVHIKWLREKIEEAYPDCDVELNFGGQPIYYYIISVE